MRSCKEFLRAGSSASTFNFRLILVLFPTAVIGAGSPVIICVVAWIFAISGEIGLAVVLICKPGLKKQIVNLLKNKHRKDFPYYLVTEPSFWTTWDLNVLDIFKFLIAHSLAFCLWEAILKWCINELNLQSSSWINFWTTYRFVRRYLRLY